MSYSTTKQSTDSTITKPIISYVPGMMYLQSTLANFQQTGSEVINDISQTYGSGDKVEIINRKKISIPCTIAVDPVEFGGRICPECGARLFHKDLSRVTLKDLPQGSNLTELVVQRVKYRCSNPECGKTILPPIDFKSERHRITTREENYVMDLLSHGLNNITVSELSGVDKMIVKEIDKRVLLHEFAEKDENGDWVLKKPDHFCKYLGIDEFLL